MFEICSDLSKTGLKLYYLCQHKKGQKMAKWPNQFISGKRFKKGQMATLTQTPCPRILSLTSGPLTPPLHSLILSHTLTHTQSLSLSLSLEERKFFLVVAPQQGILPKSFVLSQIN